MSLGKICRCFNTILKTTRDRGKRKKGLTNGGRDVNLEDDCEGDKRVRVGWEETGGPL